MPPVAASLPLVAPSPTHGYHARLVQAITSAAKARLFLCLSLLLPQTATTVSINTEPSTRRTCQTDRERVDCSMLLLFLTLRCSSCLRVSAAACIFTRAHQSEDCSLAWNLLSLPLLLQACVLLPFAAKSFDPCNGWWCGASFFPQDCLFLRTGSLERLLFLRKPRKMRRPPTASPIAN